MRPLRAAQALALLAIWIGAGALPAAPGRAQEPEPPKRAPAGKRAERAAKPAPEGPPTWYALSLAHAEIGINVAYFWSKGPKLRAETVIGGRKVVTVVNGDTYYAYDATSREGVAIGRSKEAIAKDAPDRRPFGRELEVIAGQGGEKVGEEEIGGRVCERHRITDDAGRREIWVTKDELRLPLRLEIYTRVTGKTIFTDFVNWSRDLPIDDGFFEPDPGVRFQRLSFEEYAASQFTPIGPVPVLYMDLVTGR
jgi:outer membrane lipoprotein-sorting protein